MNIFSYWKRTGETVESKKDRMIFLIKPTGYISDRGRIFFDVVSKVNTN